VDGEVLVVEEPPYRAIFTAFALLATGTTLLTAGALVCSGHIDADYWWPGEGWKQQAASFFVKLCAVTAAWANRHIRVQHLRALSPPLHPIVFVNLD
jgi:hypothetical protein